jgi:clan AA aspartic protease (TIGR02281 family)
MSHRRADRIQGNRGYKGVLRVTGRLNDKYYGQFLVDTGATFTVITQKLAQEMGLDRVSSLRKISVASAHQVARVPLVPIDSLQVGDKVVSPLEVLIMSLPVNLQVDGLLGVNFLEKFRVTFEFEQSILVLRKLPSLSNGIA